MSMCVEADDCKILKCIYKYQDTLISLFHNEHYLKLSLQNYNFNLKDTITNSL